MRAELLLVTVGIGDRPLDPLPQWQHEIVADGGADPRDDIGVGDPPLEQVGGILRQRRRSEAGRRREIVDRRADVRSDVLRLGRQEGVDRTDRLGTRSTSRRSLCSSASTRFNRRASVTSSGATSSSRRTNGETSSSDSSIGPVMSSSTSPRASALVMVTSPSARARRLGLLGRRHGLTGDGVGP